VCAQKVYGVEPAKMNFVIKKQDLQGIDVEQVFFCQRAAECGLAVGEFFALGLSRCSQETRKGGIKLFWGVINMK
jgi:hypothetical protein